MDYGPDRGHRRSIRLQGYDYAEAGAYFVTIVTQDRACVFGDVMGGVGCFNDAGRMVQAVWDELPVFYPGVGIDAFVVMPNHIHGIIELTTSEPDDRSGRGGPPWPPSNPFDSNAIENELTGPGGQVPGPGGQVPGPGGQAQGSGGQAQGSRGQAQGPAPTGGMGLSLPDVVHRFKTMTTKRYTDGVKEFGWPAFRGRLWQRNYYEHIVRGETALNRFRHYIDENPLRWDSDQENPRQVLR